MKRVVFAAVIALALTASAASAQVTFSGVLSSGSGLTASANWASPNTSINWIVKQSSPGGLWTYQYTLDVPSNEIDHWILELSPGVTMDQLSDFNWPAASRSVGTFNAAGPGAANPSIPGSIYGIEFTNVDALNATFAFRTSIAPTWGDAYAVNGFTEGLGNNFAYNTGFLNADPTTPAGNGTNNGKLLRPDTGPSPVIPEPGSMALAMMGLLPALGYRLKRR